MFKKDVRCFLSMYDGIKGCLMLPKDVWWCLKMLNCVQVVFHQYTNNNTDTMMEWLTNTTNTSSNTNTRFEFHIDSNTNNNTDFPPFLPITDVLLIPIPRFASCLYQHLDMESCQCHTQNFILIPILIPKVFWYQWNTMSNGIQGCLMVSNDV